MNARPVLAARPEILLQAMPALRPLNIPSGEHPRSAVKLCIPCLEGQISLGETWRKENFFHTICWYGWLEACLYLMSCIYVDVSTPSLSVHSVWLCCEYVHGRGTDQEGRKALYVYYSSFVHLISQANIDTCRWSSQIINSLEEKHRICTDCQ